MAPSEGRYPINVPSALITVDDCVTLKFAIDAMPVIKTRKKKKKCYYQTTGKRKSPNELLLILGVEWHRFARPYRQRRQPAFALGVSTVCVCGDCRNVRHHRHSHLSCMCECLLCELVVLPLYIVFSLFLVLSFICWLGLFSNHIWPYWSIIHVIVCQTVPSSLALSQAADGTLSVLMYATYDSALSHLPNTKLLTQPFFN